MPSYAEKDAMNGTLIPKTKEGLDFLLCAIANPLGIEPTAEAIFAAIEKWTGGVRVRFDEGGIDMWSLVRNDDDHEVDICEEYVDLKGIEMDAEGEELLNRRFWAAVEICESFLTEARARRENQ